MLCFSRNPIIWLQLTQTKTVRSLTCDKEDSWMCLLSIFCTFVLKIYLLYPRNLHAVFLLFTFCIVHLLSIQSNPSGESTNSDKWYNFPTLDTQNIVRWSWLQIFDLIHFNCMQIVHMAEYQWLIVTQLLFYNIIK